MIAMRVMISMIAAETPDHLAGGVNEPVSADESATTFGPCKLMQPDILVECMMQGVAGIIKDEAEEFSNATESASSSSIGRTHRALKPATMRYFC